MQAMSIIRDWQYKQLNWGLTTIRFIIQGTTQDEAITLRDGGDGWTVLEVLCHLRDFEAIFYERAKLTIEQDNAPLSFPDPDKLAAEKNYISQDLNVVFDTFAHSRAKFIGYLQSIEDDALFEKPARHPRRGPFTLNDQLLLAAHHDLLHIDQMIKILTRKETPASS